MTIMLEVLMNDAYILSACFLNSLSPPILINGRDQKPRLASPPANCRLCGEPLIEIGFPKHFAIMCDNDRCHIFRQSQANRDRNSDALPTLMPQCRGRGATYENYKAQKRENSQLLRNLDIPAREAGAMTSNKQTQLALENGIPK